MKIQTNQNSAFKIEKKASIPYLVIKKSIRQSMVLIIVFLSVISCKKANVKSDGSQKEFYTEQTNINSTLASTNYNVTVSYNIDSGAVSGNIFGLNTVYDDEKDVNWQAGAGVIPTKIDDLLPKQLRWPGGTVTTFYHWNRFSGIQGHKDSWDPAYNPANDVTPANFMNIDEYLANTAAMGTEPLIGINMGSGKRFPSHSPSGLQEAKDLVNYVLSKNPNAKYFYLDNEPYQNDANYTYTATSYAQTVNSYAVALKAAHPGIKLIANSIPNPNDLDDPNGWTGKLMSIAGSNIDFIDMHFYWSFSNTNFTNWTNQAVMLSQGIMPYKEQIKKFNRIYPSSSVKIVVLEWNIGPNVVAPATYPTQAQAALMVSEQFIQLIQSGSPMTCFWPTFWAGNPVWEARTLLDESNGFATTKMYDMFKSFFTVIPFRMKIKSTVSAVSGTDDPKRITNLAIKTNDGTKIYIYLINKDQNKASAVVDLNIQNFAFTSKSNFIFC